MKENEGLEIIKISPQEDYALVKYEDKYYIGLLNEREHPLVKTPGGVDLCTTYLPLAERLFEDIQNYGPQNMTLKSLLPWQYTLCERFIKMKHKELEELLDACFLQIHDWTYDHCDKEIWHNVFGDESSRVSEIRAWLSRCSHMQMTGACCIGNGYYSINIAYVLASIMENYTGKERQEQFRLLAELLAENSSYGPVSDLMTEFCNFDLYYGIHLEEDGPIIHKKNQHNDEIAKSATQSTPFIPADKQFTGTSIEKEVTQDVALCMNTIKITDMPLLLFFKNDNGLFDAFYLTHMDDPNIQMLRKTHGDSMYLTALGCHAFGAGAYIALCQAKYKKPVDEFSVSEFIEIMTDLRETDAYELALKSLGFALDGNNKRCIDKVITTGISSYLGVAKQHTFDKDNLRDFMQVMYNAGITVVLRKNN